MLCIWAVASNDWLSTSPSLKALYELFPGAPLWQILEVFIIFIDFNYFNIVQIIRTELNVHNSFPCIPCVPWCLWVLWGLLQPNHRLYSVMQIQIVARHCLCPTTVPVCPSLPIAISTGVTFISTSCESRLKLIQVKCACKSNLCQQLLHIPCLNCLWDVNNARLSFWGSSPGRGVWDH